MFQINDKLVCVKSGSPTNGNISEHPLIRESIYVVVHVDPPNERVSSWGIRVAGNRTWNKFGKEIWWHSDRFRKLSEIQEENRLKKSNPVDVC